jgi:hypothetical protein
MNSLDRESFAVLLKQERIKPRLARELRFVPEEIDNWNDLDMLAIAARSKNEGVLLIQTDNLYVIPYELSIGLKDIATGRAKPVVCDFCYTWQQGGKSGRITFRRESDGHTFTYLCCADLRCSLHVRSITSEAAFSRTQLHEDLTTEQRIARLKDNLKQLVITIAIQPAVQADSIE